ncbi:hypothetical protein ACWGCK_33760 [Streptomyces virginiae]
MPVAGSQGDGATGCTDGHTLQNIGWQYNPANGNADLILGTEGRALNLEAVSLGIK